MPGRNWAKTLLDEWMNLPLSCWLFVTSSFPLKQCLPMICLFMYVCMLMILLLYYPKPSCRGVGSHTWGEASKIIFEGIWTASTAWVWVQEHSTFWCELGGAEYSPTKSHNTELGLPGHFPRESLYFLKKDLFVLLERVTWRDNLSPAGLLPKWVQWADISQMEARNQEPLSGFLKCGCWSPEPETIHCFPSPLVGSWIGGWAVRTRTGTGKGCWRCRY